MRVLNLTSAFAFEIKSVRCDKLDLEILASTSDTIWKVPVREPGARLIAGVATSV